MESVEIFTHYRCKVMIQAADEDDGTKNPRPKSSKTIPAVLCAIWKRQRILSFFKGLHAQTVLSSALLLMIKEKISAIQAAEKDYGKTKNHRPKSSKTIPAVLCAIWKREGILGFFKGLRAQIFKTVLSSALFLMIKEKISAIQAADEDYGKTKNPRPKSSKTTPAVLCAIWKREGILGFFKGLRAQILKTVLSSALRVLLLSIGRSLLLTRGRLKSACLQLCRQEFAEFTCKLGGSLIYLPETYVPFEFGVLWPPPTDPTRKARTVAIKQFCLLEERNGSGLASMMVALSICWSLVLRVTLLFREIM